MADERDNRTFSAYVREAEEEAYLADQSPVTYQDFRVLVDDIQMYTDPDLSDPVGYGAPALERDQIATGAYVSPDVVFVSDPYNVYVPADRVEATGYDVSGGGGLSPDDGGHYRDPTDSVQIPAMEENVDTQYDQLPAAVTDTIMYGVPKGEHELNIRKVSESGDGAYYNPKPRPSGVSPVPEDYGMMPPVDGFEYGGVPDAVFALPQAQDQPGSGFSRPQSVAYYSTGDLLEDCDNILRLYTNDTDDLSREKLFVQFWETFEQLRQQKPRDYLKIPCKVRGILAILPDFEPYRADEIMRSVLSRNGLLQDPDYIPQRFILKIFVSYEIFAYFRWFQSHYLTMRAWIFMFSCLLCLAVIAHCVIDFIRGNIWRAVLMQCLAPLSIINICIFMDTPFTACVIRTEIELSYSAALAGVSGRLFYNFLLVFYCLSSWNLGDVVLNFIAIVLGCLTVAMYFIYESFKSSSKYVRTATGNTKQLAKRFAQSDVDYDGILSEDEIKLFFEKYNQHLTRYEIETMLMQYDFLRDGGLRFDALCAWYYKSPLDVETLTQAHANVTQFTDPLEDKMDLNLDNQLSDAEKKAMEEFGMRPSVLQSSYLGAMGAASVDNF